MRYLIINTGKLTQPFRSLGFMHLLDKIKYYWQLIKNRNRNIQFREKYPSIALPPDYMLFESFKLDYDKYYIDGRDSAGWLIECISPYISWTNKKILDWGCGPARIVRHLPSLLPDCIIYGTDYNLKTITWCKENISGVNFTTNELNPPTGYANGFFDVAYGISIFTHLSEANHHAWLNELIRILRPGGILLLTTHGIAFKEIMTGSEQKEFDNVNLIVRDKAKEGHRVYAAFHPPAFMIRLFENDFEILQHIPGIQKEWGNEQDTWILQKR